MVKPAGNQDITCTRTETGVPARARCTRQLVRCGRQKSERAVKGLPTRLVCHHCLVCRRARPCRCRQRLVYHTRQICQAKELFSFIFSLFRIRNWRECVCRQQTLVYQTDQSLSNRLPFSFSIASPVADAPPEQRRQKIEPARGSCRTRRWLVAWVSPHRGARPS
jgi:hypothetical protein